MLKFLTSFSFLYAFTILVMLLYGYLFYKSFVKNGSRGKSFPLVFIVISVACFSFLYFNINAPLALKTFSNLDHHYIRHDGFKAAGKIELGRTDTVNYKTSPYSSFLLQKNNDKIQVSSAYSEEPFYAAIGNSYKILSANYPAGGHQLSLELDSAILGIKAVSDTSFELSSNGNTIAKRGRDIRKGIVAWNLFKDDMQFINSAWYSDAQLVNLLHNIMLLRDDVSGSGAGELKFFLSGRVFRFCRQLNYDGKPVHAANLAFTKAIEDKTAIAWGIGFLDNNKNQFRVNLLGADSFSLINRYPVSYPLTEEKKNNWNEYRVNKFLVADARDMQLIPAVFNEGFMFSPFAGDNSLGFSPMLLSYEKAKANSPLNIEAKFLGGTGSPLIVPGNQFMLPAKTDGIGWLFSIQNSYNWNLGSFVLSAKQWQLLLLGTLVFFFLLVLGNSFSKPPHQLSWIWQLLSCVTIVLLTTRFFLYWRYKTFPPYEGLDLPSVQQLNSIWNFGIIIVTGVILSLIFGFDFIKYLYRNSLKKAASLLGISLREKDRGENLFSEKKITLAINGNRIVKRNGARFVFFRAWIVILVGGGGFAAINDFDPTTCRHLAIGLVLLYFLFIYISYRHSPLVVSAEKSWWRLSTGKPFDIVINNPVKVLLSISLLGLFAFVDIGFAIVFLNFLLFNEAFLCINYAIAGLSAGSKKNAGLFGMLGSLYLLAFAINLVYGSYIFKYLLELPQLLYIAGYALFALLVSYAVVRLLHTAGERRRMLTGLSSAILLFAIAFLFFPKERIVNKAAITKYRIDVMTMPVDSAIKTAYEEGKTYEPVIRAAQNQWFINTFIYEENNPGVNKAGFNMLPHAPQNKGAKYNAQATDLVASRFFIAEHGKWSVLLYVLLLLVPTTLLASFYKLYPDFTNRINSNYPTITTGFSLLNYLLITALLVILAATGRYIFFGQDLPFGSILSKQSILFPAILIIAIVLLFRHIPLEQYPNRKKLLPGGIVFSGLGLLLFLVKPQYNKGREFSVADLAKEMDTHVQLRLQPVFEHFDSAKATRRLPMIQKDRLFTDSIKKLLAAGFMDDAGEYFRKEVESYTRTDFSRHLDQRRMVYLDLYSGRPQLAVNDNYFRIEPPPHLQQYWTGNVFGDSSNYNISIWISAQSNAMYKRVARGMEGIDDDLGNGLHLLYGAIPGKNRPPQLYLVNRSEISCTISTDDKRVVLSKKDTIVLANPSRWRVGNDMIITTTPDAFMKNYYVNGSRYYVYPMGSDFIWARNFAESISSEYTAAGQPARNAFVSLDAGLMDSLSIKIKTMMIADTAYKQGAEYGICIADGNGRLIAMSDFIKGLDRPDPNDKAAFNTVIRSDNGYVSQSLLRKQIGNINLLRMNPGPGSTLKPIIFSSIASQLNLDWDAFAAEGFTQKQQYFGGEKVAEYDFEKNNGRISSVVDYLRYSDNYYHSNLLLLGSYSKQELRELLMSRFATQNPESGFHWPHFSYQGKQYWLNGFENWPGYTNGKANFGSDSSFVSAGLFSNYGIYTFHAGKGVDKFPSAYDSLLFRSAYKKSGFILPEYALFDQKGTGMDNRKPNEVFMSSFRGHVKGSSQVMVPPVKMLDAFGKLASQNRNYSLTLNPYAAEPVFRAFAIDSSVSYNRYLSITREKIFEGLKQALFKGTAARLGTMLKDGTPYYYYAKTGTTGDDDAKAKSKLFAIIISEKDITDPDFNFRKNKFYTIYFTSQNGPVKQNEEFQAMIIRYVQRSEAFINYMKGRH